MMRGRKREPPYKRFFFDCRRKFLCYIRAKRILYVFTFRKVCAIINSLEGGAFMALYENVRDTLKDKIHSGVLKEGDMIPTEMQLAEMFHVSRPTIRRALNDLVVDGFLRRVKGTGTFVTKPKILQEYTKFIESYQAEMDKKHYSVKTVVIETSQIRADEFLAQKLEIKPGEILFCLQQCISRKSCFQICFPTITRSALSIKCWMKIAFLSSRPFVKLKFSFLIDMFPAICKLKKTVPCFLFPL